MVELTHSVKITLSATLISLLIYAFYIAKGSYLILFGYLTNSSWETNYVNWLGISFWASHIGVTARFIAAIVALTAVYLLWIKHWPFTRVKSLVAAALVLESLNFIGLIPGVWIMLNPESPIFIPPLGYGYLIQVLFTVPFLWVLAHSVAKYNQSNQKLGLLKVGALAFVGYTVALVANEVSRWVGMVNAESLQFIEGLTAVGFYNAFALMPFAIVFAVAGAVKLFQKKTKSATMLFGASLLVTGLNYTVYLVYTVLIDRLNTLPVVDIWTLPLLALGISLIIYAHNLKLKDAVA